MAPIVMRTLPTECIGEQLPHLELGHSDASQGLRRGEKNVLSTSRDPKKKKRRGELVLESCAPRAGKGVASRKECKHTLVVMDGNEPLSVREEELNIQRRGQREKEVLVLGCLATGALPRSHRPS